MVAYIDTDEVSFDRGGAQAFLVENKDESCANKQAWLADFKLDEAGLTSSQKRQTEALLLKYVDAISTHKEDLEKCVNETSEINTGGATPVKLR